MKRAIILTTAILFLVAANAPARGQDAPAAARQEEVTVHTTTGLKFVGRIISEDGDKVALQMRSGAVEIPRNIIKQIERSQDRDRRPASERVAAIEVPAGQEAAFLEKAAEAFKEGQWETVVGIAKGMQPRLSGLNATQRESIHKLAAAAYFELKDWKATAVSLRFASRSLETELDRQRLDAVAEAVEASSMPDVGGQTVENFEQLKAAAMKWKAEQFLKQSIDFMTAQKELHRQEALSKALEVAKTTLTKAEPYVPGFSIERWPDVCKATAAYMLTAVERVIPVLTEEREELVRTYVAAISSLRHAQARNEIVNGYLLKRQASAGTLENLTWMEQTTELKELFDNEKAKNLTKQIEEFRFYHRDPTNFNRIKIKGLEIKPMAIGG